MVAEQMVSTQHHPDDPAPIEAEALPAFTTDPVVVEYEAIEAFAVVVALEQRLARLVRMQQRTTAERERLGLPRTPDDATLDQGIAIVHRALRRTDRALGYTAPPESESELRAAYGDR